mgnify:CR=1 FL=1
MKNTGFSPPQAPKKIGKKRVFLMKLLKMPPLVNHRSRSEGKKKITVFKDFLGVFLKSFRIIWDPEIEGKDRF